MPPRQLEYHSNIGFAVDPAAVEHPRLQDSIEATLQEFPVYLIGVAAARIALILLCAQFCADLRRPRSELGSEGMAGSDGIGGHCALYANSRRWDEADRNGVCTRVSALLSFARFDILRILASHLKDPRHEQIRHTTPLQIAGMGGRREGLLRGR